jgi:hypothetical protein
MYNLVRFTKLRSVAMHSLCLLEKAFPPNFFDLMTHVVIHLIDELELCGLVHIRWMYPIEHAMTYLKRYVYNMVKLEGFMAKGYIVDEALNLCNEYMQGFGAT